MISEHKFAAGYTSFWRTALPLGEPVMRRINSRLSEFASSYDFIARPERSALISEVSFRLVALAMDANRHLGSGDWLWDSISVECAVEAAYAYLSRLKGAPLMEDRLRKQELQVAVDVAERLRRFFLAEKEGGPLLPLPQFEGCGLISSCEGDMMVGTVLYEIKNVDRNFRLTDLRQVITYCALNYVVPRYRITGIGLVNARSGKFYRIGVEPLAKLISGMSASELFSNIIDFISTEQVSG
jgi:hypothetical protein